MKLSSIAPATIFFARGWAAPSPTVLEPVSAPLAADLPSGVVLIDIDNLGNATSILTTRAPFPGISAFLNFQSIGCASPVDLIVPNVNTGACLQAVRGGLTWLIRSGDMSWVNAGPAPSQCRMQFFQNQGCLGLSTPMDTFNICRNNQPNGFWSFRVTC